MGFAVVVKHACSRFFLRSQHQVLHGLGLGLELGFTPRMACHTQPEHDAWAKNRYLSTDAESENTRVGE